MSDWYRLEGKQIIKIEDFDILTDNNRVIINSTVINDNIRVSTVFLSLDHNWGSGPPLVFETMIFGGVHNEYQEGYSTYDDAVAGHKHAYKMAYESKDTRVSHDE